MTYLYAGLGIAMITGIAAMMQIGNNINNLLYLNLPKKDNYMNSSLPKDDKKIMKLLYDKNVPEENVCDFIKSESSGTVYNDGAIFKFTGTQTPLTNNPLKVDCVIVNHEKKHRILITKKDNDIYRYGMFSCFLENDIFENIPICEFELKIKSVDEKQ